jgi:mRNA interferase RelE/StbE
VSWVRLTVELSPAAQRDLRALDGTIRSRLVKAVARYAETGAGDVKQLQGSTDYRLRVGDYRVRFAIVAGQVLIMLVIRVGHRREVYR